MGTGHVLGDGRVSVAHGRERVAGNALALVEDLDRRAGDARLDDLADQLRGHRVEVIVDLDVIVRRDARPLPFGVSVGLVRQRLQGRPLQRLQQLGAALADAPHDLGVDRRDAVADRSVQLGQREERPIAQLRQNEALDDLHSNLDLGLVARLDDARRQHDAVIVIGKILVRAIDARLVARRLGNARLEIVRHQGLRHAADRSQCIDVRAYPIRQRLRPTRLGVGVVRGAERRDENAGAVFLAVAGSTTPIVSPAQSTNSFSPARCVCRIVAETVCFQ